ncbi:CBS domain-containing protein [Streptacidiphilus fuscans]|uniref:CBS domain-containing protein n=1 Tax=Streptacidiphilus fuscans TaxID=2789292 RepID=A0A931B6F4_9ACTN|nr:CBS domain-containing protein [Streptacidiphilus fuscans]MBF9069507.1 CBS domain-containing protein [Streptacidiphilus fuscans]
MPLTVAQVLAAKPDGGGTVHTIGKDRTVLDALTLMAAKGIGALVVMAEGQIAGIVTERDYARKVELHGHSAATTRVEEIMTARVRYVEPTQTADECMALMTEHRMRHLPVLDAGRLSGIVSIGDLLKQQIADQQFTIDQLEHYIHGAPIAAPPR